MRIRSFRLVLAGAMVVAIPATGAMANPDLHWQFDGFAGGHFFNEKNELGARDVASATEPDHSVAFGVRLGYWFAPMFGIEAEGAAMPTEASVGTASAEQFLVAYRLSAKMEFDAGRVLPFLLVGGGGVSNASERNDILLDDTDFVWHAGGGARFAVAHDWGIRADARLLLPPSTATEGVTAEFEGLVGLYRMFGGTGAEPAVETETSDPDNDGVVGDADKCANEAEDKDGFEDDNGCPDPDNDGDGVADASDQCATEAETMNQIDDTDGCPEKDEDGDTLLGSADQCPTEAEDKDGFEDENGCPDADNDGDQVVDASDKCQGELETAQGYQDDDGCPDEVPPAIQKLTGVIKGVSFKGKTAELTKSSSRVLDKTAAMLTENPSIRLEIGVHTDNTGDVAQTQPLTQERADAIKTYLLGKGIAAERLEAKGYGADKPLADNATKSGQSKNRRVEFSLVVGVAAPAAPAPAAPAPAAPSTQPSQPAPAQPAPAQPAPAPAPQPQPAPGG
jgi:OOP family OmpA-OmpF porin